MRHLWIGLLVTACSGDEGLVIDAALPADTVVFVVRHAETTSGSLDPSLSTEGQARAQALATLLAPENVAAIYTSQYLRTRETAAPLADATSVAIQVRTVDGSNAATYGTELATLVHDTNSAQAVLIVGHSNTVPDTVKALSGVTIPPIAETEYNRLYTITLAADGPHMVAGTY